ncbi:MAG: hypothetical protein IT462_11055 [Planctomycetes bacterium]|nr:hypothetical protein [Planctomycetota bacterium]
MCGLSLILLVLLAAPLRADSPASEATTDRTLAEARVALSRGLTGAALERSTAALKRAPLGAPENLQMALTLWWVGQFDDAARYLRRALADNPEILGNEPKLRERVPSAQVNDKILAVAKLADQSAELCFLTGTLLLIDRDQGRAMPFLVRSEELAGTDGQASTLIGAIDASPRPDRNLTRGLREMQEGDLDRAQRSFAFAALDRPQLCEAYAGWTLALVAAAQDAEALRMADTMQARCPPQKLLNWLAGGKLAALSDAGTRLEKAADAVAAPVPHLRLAMICFFAAGYYGSAQRCGVSLLVQDKLDDYTLQALDYMSARKLNDDPFKAAPDRPLPTNPDKPPVVPPTQTPTEAARAAMKKADYATAMQLLEPQVDGANTPVVVLHLLFVCLVGRGELIDAGSAFQAWWSRASDDERTRTNAVREIFAKGADYDAWLKQLTNARDADLSAALPRMLIAYTEICDGKYESARVSLSVALRAENKNFTLQSMDRLMAQPKFAADTGRPKVEDTPDPIQLMARGEQQFKDRKYPEALASFLAAAERDRKLKGIGAALLKAMFAAGQYDDAANHLLRLFDDLDVANKGADAFTVSVFAGYLDSAEFDKHLAALRQTCDARKLASAPWLVLGAVLYGKHDYNGARDALQVYRENERGKPNKAAVMLLESAKKQAR